MLNFRKELIEIVESKRGNQAIKNAAENFLKQTLEVIKKTDDKEIAGMKKLMFVLTSQSVIVLISSKISGIYYSDFKQYNKEVFEELKRRMKLENFVFLEEIEGGFTIAIP